MAVEFSAGDLNEENKKKGGKVEELGKSYSEFKKIHSKEYKSLIDHFKKKGYSKAGMDDLLLQLWILESLQGGSAKNIFKKARRLLGKLTLKGLQSFFSLFKLVPTRFFKK